MTLKKAILLYRAKNNISMKEFAKRCGVSVQTVYNIETVEQKPSRVTQAKIELLLGDEFKIDEYKDKEEV